MDIGRQSLPHELPLWVDVEAAVFFITCCAKERIQKPFAVPSTALGLRDSIRHRVQSRIWWVYAACIMPDHVHVVLRFSQGVDVAKCIRDWKRWTSRAFGFEWQRDFFEHRLRHDESFDEKTRYVLENPVRAGLVEDWRAWPFTILGYE
jgi:REP element-mobilizing transposase RayT